jgi:gamma-glutamylcyclotransferase (GGCT)/AIG2-like uncharacterized protein YtfP
MNIFTYGTLMIPEVMVAVTTRKFRSTDATLKGYARFTVKGESYPGITPEPGAITEGVIYFDVHDWSLERLDAFEGNLYQRIQILAQTNEKEILSADAYVVKPKFRSYLSSIEWSMKEFAQKHLKTFLETYTGFQRNS